jgi:hypothetical protein
VKKRTDIREIFRAEIAFVLTRTLVVIVFIESCSRIEGFNTVLSIDRNKVDSLAMDGIVPISPNRLNLLRRYFCYRQML